MTLYSIIHGPEIWLAIIGFSGAAIFVIIFICIVNSSRLREIEERARRGKTDNEHKDDL